MDVKGFNYGLGTFASPKVKFFINQTGFDQLYFSKTPVVPTFQMTGEEQVLCNLCGESSGSGQQLVLHWQKETKKLTKHGFEKFLIGPLLELTPPSFNSNENVLDEYSKEHNASPSISDEDCETVVKEEYDSYSGEEEDIESEVSSEEKEDEVDPGLSCKVQLTEPLSPSFHIKLENDDEQFQCEQCAKYFGSRKHLYGHVRIVHGSKRYPCNECEYQATTKATLRRHKRIHSKSQGEATGEPKVKDKYPCEICSYQGTRSHVIAHIKAVHIGIKYPCDKCDYQATTKSSLKRHTETHLENNEEIDSEDKAKALLKYEERKRIGRERRRLSYQKFRGKVKETNPESLISCEECDAEVRPHKIKLHMIKKHSIQKLYNCDQCDYIAKFSWNLKDHKRRVHCEERFFLCHLCDSTYKTQNGLTVHIKAKHEDNQEFRNCEKCDFRTIHPSSISNHMRMVHKEGEAFQCEYCEFSSFAKQSLQTHVNTEHLGIHQECDKCEFRTKTKQQLQQHIDTVHLGIRYSCSHCDYNTNNKHVLKAHVQSKHEGVRFNCTHCPFSASFETNLRKHWKTNHHEAAWISYRYQERLVLSNFQ